MPDDILALVWRELVLEEDPFEVPAMLSRSLARVCKSWNERLGVDALLWCCVSPATGSKKELCEEDQETRVRYQFAALEKHSRDVGLHLRLAREDAPLVRPYLLNLAHRWVSIVTEAHTWGNPFELTQLSGNRPLPQPLLPALRRLRLCDANPGRPTEFDLLQYGAALEDLDLHITRRTDQLAGQNQMGGRVQIPMPPTLTSLALSVANGAEFSTTSLHWVLQSCSETLQRLEVRLCRTYNEMTPTELPKLQSLKVHGLACSLLQVLQVRALEILWVHQDSNMGDSGLSLLHRALVENRISGSTLRRLQLTHAWIGTRVECIRCIANIFDNAATLEHLALAYEEDTIYRPVCNVALDVLALRRDGFRLPHLKRLVLARGMCRGEVQTEKLLERVLRARRGSELHVLSDVRVQHASGESMCTYTLVDDLFMRRCLVDDM